MPSKSKLHEKPMKGNMRRLKLAKITLVKNYVSQLLEELIDDKHEQMEKNYNH